MSNIVSNLGEDLQEHEQQQRRQHFQQQQQQQQEQQQRDLRDTPNVTAPRPDSECSATQNETTDDDVQDLRKDLSSEQQQPQQQQQQQQQRDRRKLSDLIAPRPDTDLSATHNETTKNNDDDDFDDVQDFLEEDQEHAVGQEPQTALASPDEEADEIDLSAAGKSKVTGRGAILESKNCEERSVKRSDGVSVEERSEA